MSFGILRGAAAGAAGATALNTATYLDMAVRGRATSSAPEQLADNMAREVGLDIPGKGDVRDNRLEGLGAVLGSGVGVVVGAAAGAVHRAFHKRGRKIPAPIAIVVVSAAAMAMSDVPLKLFGISDPATWSAKDWTSDALPHLVYGIVTCATIKAAAESGGRS